ncbi:hypothetical protein [Parasphingorhabdus halotolerans]|uniref:Ferric reductase like transmembrane component n=1 Tax=Parasphingorhabdus halotolerans TaxID=2725558 RepID=A0A6H2DP50_9SPHN|nr:hypothetical protein [Parasphingorhabdus halotolerans]QJB70439.1 hypothetical protein HF685_15165 [Parasphingorhabdus halotolerans]
MASVPAPGAPAKKKVAMHDGFLGHAGYRWLKISSAIMLVCIVSYFFVDVSPRHNGGSWYGYTLGTIGALLILWLTMLGVRKRAMTSGRWSLKAWTSAHIYLGLSLVVIGTLHTGFQFGWNIHTAAYAFMMIVIISGIFGIYYYATLPQALSDNRDEMTETQMLESLRSLDRQLHESAQPLSAEHAALVLQSLEQDPFGGGFFRRISGKYPNCATRQAQADLRRERAYQPRMGGEDPLDKVDALLEKKEATLARVRRHLKLKATLQVWLFVHVPITFALIASLSAHIISVFFYW